MARRRARGGTTLASLTASAALLTSEELNLTKVFSWQDESWGYYEGMGELRFAVNWLSNGMSRVRLVPARRAPGAQEPTPLEEDDPGFDLANQALGLLGGGPSGQAQIMGDLAVQLSVPGIGYLLGMADELGVMSWRVLSINEIRKRGQGAGATVQLQTAENVWIDLNVGTDVADDGTPPVVLTKIWRPNRRFHWQPDSPVRALLPILRELSLLSQYVDATATSRIAGAGLLLMPEEMSFASTPEQQDSADPFTAVLIDVMGTAIREADSAGRTVPIVVRMAGEWIKEVRHLSFATPFDTQAQSLRKEAIDRFATGMDIPAEIVTGMAPSNHWTAWQISSAAVHEHIAPMCETSCEGLTLGFYQPVLKALGVEDEDLCLWYDLSEIEGTSDKSDKAAVLYDRVQLGSAALRRESGFDEADMPTDEDMRRLWFTEALKRAPGLIGMVLHSEGIPTTLPDAPIDLTGGAPTVPQTVPSIGDHPTGDPLATPPAITPGVPSTRNATPDNNASPPTAVASLDALIASCDGVVFRALERAGNRINNRTRSLNGATHLVASGCPPALMHTCVDDPTALGNLDGLLDGAWDRVGAIADRYEIDPDSLTAALDSYTRQLLASRTAHTFDLLASRFLGPIPVGA